MENKLTLERKKDMKIEEQKLFLTPPNWKYVEDWIQLQRPEERLYFYTAAFMTWNLAAKITNEEEECLLES